MKKHAVSLVKAVFAVLLLFGLFWIVGAPALLQSLAQIDLTFVLLLLAITVVMIWASCLKWRLFIRAGGKDASMSRLMQLYTMGYFFNSFMPSVVGGDIMRSMHLSNDMGSKKDAFVATFLERFTGLLAMAMLGVVFVLAGASATKGLSFAIYLVGLGTGILALACFSARFGAIVFGLVRTILSRMPSHSLLRKADSMIVKLDAAMSMARGDKWLFFEALVLSLLFHLLTVINTYVAGLAVGWTDPSFMGLFVVVPLVLLVSMVPITPNGLGIQEGAFLFLLKRIGATEAQGLGVGLVLRAKAMLLAVVGGLLWMWVRKHKAELQ